MNKTQTLIVSAIAAFGLAGCDASMTHNETVGTVGGAVAGGLIGSAVSGGDAGATIGGAAVGGLLGHSIGSDRDDRHRHHHRHHGH